MYLESYWLVILHLTPVRLDASNTAQMRDVRRGVGTETTQRNCTFTGGLRFSQASVAARTVHLVIGSSII